MDHSHNLTFARSSGLEGERQTVPRAELSAVIDAMGTLPMVAHLEAVVDASYVVKNGSRIARALDGALRVSRQQAEYVMRFLDQLYGCNGDLWTRFAEVYIERKPPMRFTWIKSHQTARMVVSGAFPKRDLHGNILADAFAEKAAELVQLPEGTVEEYFSARATAHHIRRRLIAVHRSINKHEAENGKQDVVRIFKEKRQPKPRMTQVYAEDLLRQLGHEPSFFEAKGATCFQCRLCKCVSTIRKIGDITRGGKCSPVVPVQPTYIERAEEIIRNSGGRRGGSREEH